MIPEIVCTVRNCLRLLVPQRKRLVCAAGHSFDLARSGYCNLLQPQDRRSLHPGDSAEAVKARRRFLDAGHGKALTAAMVEIANPLAGEAVLDAGCGEGHHLTSLPAVSEGIAGGVGIDISVPAIDAAASRHQHCTWLVANCDRFLPFEDHSFALVMSITSRMQEAEFWRVLRREGRLLIVLPSPRDLIELRQAILGRGDDRDRTERAMELFRENFVLERRERIEVTETLDHQAILDVMSTSYRGLRTREAERVATLEAMDVTLGRDLLLFRPS